MPAACIPNCQLHRVQSQTAWTSVMSRISIQGSGYLIEFGMCEKHHVTCQLHIRCCKLAV
jgi:hypothetical protein